MVKSKTSDTEINSALENSCQNLPFHQDVSHCTSHVLQKSKKNGKGKEKQELVLGKFLLPTFPG